MMGNIGVSGGAAELSEFRPVFSGFVKCLCRVSFVVVQVYQ